LHAEVADAVAKTTAKANAVAMKKNVKRAVTINNMKKKTSPQSSIGKWLNEEAHHKDEPQSVTKQKAKKNVRKGPKK
jgi:hypothetical protein